MNNHDFVGEGSIERAAADRSKLTSAVTQAASRLLKRLTNQFDPDPDGMPRKKHSERRLPPHEQ